MDAARAAAWASIAVAAPAAEGEKRDPFDVLSSDEEEEDDEDEDASEEGGQGR